MSIEALAAEIAKDAYANMDDAAILESLNAKTVSALKPISSAELLAWAALSGRYVKLEDAANDITKSPEVRSACKAAIKMIERDGTSLDLSRSDRSEAMSLLAQGGVVSLADVASLRALATYQVSWAEQNGFGEVRKGELQMARAAQ